MAAADVSAPPTQPSAAPPKKRWLDAWWSRPLIGGLLAFGVIILPEYDMVGRWGLGTKLLYILYPLVPFLLILGAAAMVALMPFGVIFRKTRAEAIRLFPFGLFVLVGGVAGFYFSEPYRDYAFSCLAERSKSLIAAIEHFERDHGAPPETLEKLVPKYLPAVPRTGMPGYPTYDYQVSKAGQEIAGNKWMLSVDCIHGIFIFDVFVYLPNHDYDNYNPPNGCVPRCLGDWAYYMD